jgi:hypothetical protein
MVTHHSHALGEPVECLELKASQINTLQLFGGIGHEKLLATGF